MIEKTAHKQLMNSLDENNPLSTRQFGFKTRMLAELAATLLLDDIRKNVDIQLLRGAMFIDLIKALDTISHSRMLTKLSSYGITAKTLDCLRIIYLISQHKWATIMYYQKLGIQNLVSSMA